MMYCLTEEEYRRLKDNSPLQTQYEEQFQVVMRQTFKDMGRIVEKYYSRGTAAPPGMLQELHEMISARIRSLTPPSTDATPATSAPS